MDVPNMGLHRQQVYTFADIARQTVQPLRDCAAACRTYASKIESLPDDCTTIVVNGLQDWDGKAKSQFMDDWALQIAGVANTYMPQAILGSLEHGLPAPPVLPALHSQMLDMAQSIDDLAGKLERYLIAVQTAQAIQTGFLILTVVLTILTIEIGGEGAIVGALFETLGLDAAVVALGGALAETSIGAILNILAPIVENLVMPALDSALIMGLMDLAQQQVTNTLVWDPYRQSIGLPPAEVNWNEVAQSAVLGAGVGLLAGAAGWGLTPVLQEASPLARQAIQRGLGIGFGFLSDVPSQLIRMGTPGDLKGWDWNEFLLSGGIGGITGARFGDLFAQHPTLIIDVTGPDGPRTLYATPAGGASFDPAHLTVVDPQTGALLSEHLPALNILDPRTGAVIGHATLAETLLDGATIHQISTGKALVESAEGVPLKIKSETVTTYLVEDGRVRALSQTETLNGAEIRISVFDDRGNPILLERQAQLQNDAHVNITTREFAPGLPPEQIAPGHVELAAGSWVAFRPDPTVSVDPAIVPTERVVAFTRPMADLHPEARPVDRGTTELYVQGRDDQLHRLGAVRQEGRDYQFHWDAQVGPGGELTLAPGLEGLTLRIVPGGAHGFTIVTGDMQRFTVSPTGEVGLTFASAQEDPAAHTFTAGTRQPPPGETVAAEPVASEPQTPTETAPALLPAGPVGTPQAPETYTVPITHEGQTVFLTATGELDAHGVLVVRLDPAGQPEALRTMAPADVVRQVSAAFEGVPGQRGTAVTVEVGGDLRPWLGARLHFPLPGAGVAADTAGWARSMTSATPGAAFDTTLRVGENDYRMVVSVGRAGDEAVVTLNHLAVPPGASTEELATSLATGMREVADALGGRVRLVVATGPAEVMAMNGATYHPAAARVEPGLDTIAARADLITDGRQIRVDHEQGVFEWSMRRFTVNGNDRLVIESPVLTRPDGSRTPIEPGSEPHGVFDSLVQRFRELSPLPVEVRMPAAHQDMAKTAQAAPPSEAVKQALAVVPSSPVAPVSEPGGSAVADKPGNVEATLGGDNEVASPFAGGPLHGGSPFPQHVARTFTSNDEASRYGEDVWADARKQLTRAQKNAVQDYAGVDYAKTNASLRKGEPPGSNVQRIDQALSVKPVPEAVRVFRAVDKDAFSRPIDQLPGTSEDLQAYTSTELRATPKYAAWKEVLLELKVEPETPAMYLGDELGNPGEHELLLGRNLVIRYERVELEKRPWGDLWHVHATIGPGESKPSIPSEPKPGEQIIDVSGKASRGAGRTRRLSEDMLMRNLDGTLVEGLKDSGGELIGPVKPTTPPPEVPVVRPNFAERIGQEAVSIDQGRIQVLGDRDLATGARIERRHTPGGVDLTSAELEMYARELIERRMYHPESYPGEGGALLVRLATATEPAAVVLVDNPGSSSVRVPDGWVALMHYHPYGHLPGDRPSSGDVLAARNTPLEYLYVIHHASTDTAERAMILRITREAPADGHNWPNDPIWDLKSPGLAQRVGAGAELGVAMADPARIARAEDARDHVGWVVSGDGPQRIVNAAAEDRALFQAGMQSIGLVHERLVGRLWSALQEAADLLVRYPEHADLARSINDHLTNWDGVEFALNAVYHSRVVPPNQPIPEVSAEDAALVRRLHEDLVRWTDVYARLRESAPVSAEGTTTPRPSTESQILETPLGKDPLVRLAGEQARAQLEVEKLQNQLVEHEHQITAEYQAKVADINRGFDEQQAALQAEHNAAIAAIKEEQAQAEAKAAQLLSEAQLHDQAVLAEQQQKPPAHQPAPPTRAPHEPVKIDLRAAAEEAHAKSLADLEIRIEEQERHLRGIQDRLAELAHNSEPVERAIAALDFMKRLAETYDSHIDAARARLTEFADVARQVPTGGPIGRAEAIAARRGLLDGLVRSAGHELHEAQLLDRLVQRALRYGHAQEPAHLFTEFGAEPRKIAIATVVDALRVQEYLTRQGLEGLVGGDSIRVRADWAERRAASEQQVRRLRAQDPSTADAASLIEALRERRALDLSRRRFLRHNPELLPIERALVEHQIRDLSKALPEAFRRGDEAAYFSISDDLTRAERQLRWIGDQSPRTERQVVGPALNGRELRDALAASRTAAHLQRRYETLSRRLGKASDPSSIQQKMDALSRRIIALDASISPVRERLLAGETGARPRIAGLQQALNTPAAGPHRWTDLHIAAYRTALDDSLAPVRREREELAWQETRREAYTRHLELVLAAQSLHEVAKADALMAELNAWKVEGPEALPVHQRSAPVPGPGADLGVLGNPKNWPGVTEVVDLSGDGPARMIHRTHRGVVHDWLAGIQRAPDIIGGRLPVESTIQTGLYQVTTEDGAVFQVREFRHETLVIDSRPFSEGGLSMLRLDGGLKLPNRPPLDLPPPYLKLGPFALVLHAGLTVPNIDLQYIPALRRDFFVYDHVGERTFEIKTLTDPNGDYPADWTLKSPATELRLAPDQLKTVQLYTKWGVQPVIGVLMLQLALGDPALGLDHLLPLGQVGGVGLVQVTGEASLFWDAETGKFLRPDWGIGAEALVGDFVSLPSHFGDFRLHPDVSALFGWDPSPGTVTLNRVVTYNLKPYAEFIGRKIPLLRDLSQARIAAEQAKADQAAAELRGHEAEVRTLLATLQDPLPPEHPVAQGQPYGPNNPRPGEVAALRADAAELAGMLGLGGGEPTPRTVGDPEVLGRIDDLAARLAQSTPGHAADLAGELQAIAELARVGHPEAEVRTLLGRALKQFDRADFRPEPIRKPPKPTLHHQEPKRVQGNAEESTHLLSQETSAAVERPTGAGGRIETMVPGVWEGIDPAQKSIGPWRFKDYGPYQNDDVIYVTTKVTNIDIPGSGTVIRKLNTRTAEFVMKSVVLWSFPGGRRWVRTAPEMVTGKGTPLETYVTLRQMKLLAQAGGDIEIFGRPHDVVMADITNPRTVLHLAQMRKAWELNNFNSPFDLTGAVEKTHSLNYARNSITQSGGEIASIAVSGGAMMPAGAFLKTQSYLTSAERTELLNRYGLSPDHQVLVNFSINLHVVPAKTPSGASVSSVLDTELRDLAARLGGPVAEASGQIEALARQVEAAADQGVLGDAARVHAADLAKELRAIIELADVGHPDHELRALLNNVLDQLNREDLRPKPIKPHAENLHRP